MRVTQRGDPSSAPPPLHARAGAANGGGRPGGGGVAAADWSPAASAAGRNPREAPGRRYFEADAPATERGFTAAPLSPEDIFTSPWSTAPFSIMSEGVSTLPRTLAERCSSMALFALMFPFTSPSTTTVPQVISASMRACSPTTSTSFVTIEPTNFASMRTVPLNVSLPSNSAPAPSSRSLVPPVAPLVGSSSRVVVAMPGRSSYLGAGDTAGADTVPVPLDVGNGSCLFHKAMGAFRAAPALGLDDGRSARTSLVATPRRGPAFQGRPNGLPAPEPAAGQVHGIALSSPGRPAAAPPPRPALTLRSFRQLNGDGTGYRPDGAAQATVRATAAARAARVAAPAAVVHGHAARGRTRG